jgi:hypothetical protein
MGIGGGGQKQGKGSNNKYQLLSLHKNKAVWHQKDMVSRDGYKLEGLEG